MDRAVIVVAALALGSLISCEQLVGIDERSAEATVECSGGHCSCRAPLVDCDEDLSNGCDDLQTSIEHCGSCGAQCGGNCIEGRCQPQVLFTSVGEPFGRFGLDDDFAYVGGCSDLSRVSLTTLAVESIATSATEACGAPVRIGPEGWVYWASYDQLMFVRPDGTVPGAVGNPQTLIWDIAVDDQDLFWVDVGAMTSTLWRLPIDGGADAIVGDVGPAFDGELEVRDRKVYVVSGGGNPEAFIREFDLRDGNAVRELDMPKPAAWSLAVDDSHVYWTDEVGGLWRQPFGGVAADPLATGDAIILSVAVDDLHAYYSDALGTVARIPLGGGEVETLALEQDDPQRLLVDDEYVYWKTFTQLVRMKKLP
jgi:hypothetical protein